MSIVYTLRCNRCQNTMMEQSEGTCGINLGHPMFSVYRSWQKLVDVCTHHFCSKKCLLEYFAFWYERAYDDAQEDPCAGK